MAHCRRCTSLTLPCTFLAPIFKRGPIPRSRKEGHQAQPHDSGGDADELQTGDHGHPVTGATTGTSDRRIPRPLPYIAPRSTGGPAPLHWTGLPMQAIDELLAVYFTHIHHIWPMIYKPFFDVHTTPPLLLLAMLSLASCNQSSPTSITAHSERLYRMAEKRLEVNSGVVSVEAAQSLILMSLRQTGMGRKGAAYNMAGRAIAMVLQLDLSSRSKTGGSDQARDTEVWSRLFWTAYVLDKCMSEETNRSCCMRYKHCTMPLPSTDEMDDFESWPPTTASTAGRMKSVQHLAPRRGYVITCFVWTIRMAMIVEEILEIPSTDAPVLAGDDWDAQFASRRSSLRTEVSDLEQQLSLWRISLPSYLDAERADILSPLPCAVVNLAYYHTATLLYHAAMSRRAPRLSSRPSDSPSQAFYVHRNACSMASFSLLDLIRRLDEQGLLTQVTSDIIHMLCLAMMVQFTETMSSDAQRAAQATSYLDQSSLWLKHLSSSWPGALMPIRFFNALSRERQGSIELSLNLASSALGDGGMERIRRIIRDEDDSGAQKQAPSNSRAALPPPISTGGTMAVDDLDWMSDATNPFALGDLGASTAYDGHVMSMSDYSAQPSGYAFADSVSSPFGLAPYPMIDQSCDQTQAFEALLRLLDHS